MTALLPCPFCGANAFIQPSMEHGANFVECSGSDCHASIWRYGLGVEQLQNLTERWNRRCALTRGTT